MWINWESELGVVLVLIPDLGKYFPLVICFPGRKTESAFSALFTVGDAGGCWCGNIS